MSFLPTESIMPKNKAADNSQSIETEVQDVKPSWIELRRKVRSVRSSKALFKAIDALTSMSQGSCPYLTAAQIKNIEVAKDKVYDERDPQACGFDVYRVSSEEKQPAIMLIHGGGFSAGDKKFRKGVAQYFAVSGFTVFCVNYGIAPEYVFPVPVKQLITAANYIYDHADEYNIDRDRIILQGDSAGGYYASMLATMSANKEFNAKYGDDIKFEFCGAIYNCGLFDLDIVLQTKYIFDLDDGVFLSFIGHNRKDIDKFPYKEICMPSKFVNEKFPPCFFIYSPNDLLCKGQAESMLDLLKDKGVYYESFKARHVSSNHCFSLFWRGEDSFAANEMMISFARRLANDKIKLR